MTEAEGVELALGGGLWAAGDHQGRRGYKVLDLLWGRLPNGASPSLNGPLSQDCIKGTLNAPQLCRPLLCLAALPPSCTTAAAPAPHTALLSPGRMSVPSTSCPEPKATPALAATSEPVASSKPHIIPPEADSRISKEELLRAQALREKGQAFPSLSVQLQGGHGPLAAVGTVPPPLPSTPIPGHHPWDSSHTIAPSQSYLLLQLFLVLRPVLPTQQL